MLICEIIPQCNNCEVVFQKLKGLPGESQIKLRIRLVEHGWKTDRKRNKDICPKCLHRIWLSQKPRWGSQLKSL